MDSKKAPSFLSEKYRQIAANYDSMTADADFITFLDTSVEELTGQGKELFTSSFTEFGETFTTEYDLVALLHSDATRRIYESILQFRDRNDQEAYEQMIAAYGHVLMVQLAGLKQGKTEESLFSTDIALSLMFAIAYFPGDAPDVLRYLLFYLEQRQDLMQAKLYANRLGKPDLLPLAAFLAGEAGLDKAEAIQPYCSKPVEPAYAAAIDQLYATDEAVVNQWVDGIAAYHIANSQDDWTLPFNNITWQFFPVEIIALLVMRSRKGLNNSFISHPIVKPFLPYIVAHPAARPLLEHIRGRVKP